MIRTKLFATISTLAVATLAVATLTLAATACGGSKPATTQPAPPVAMTPTPDPTPAPPPTPAPEPRMTQTAQPQNLAFPDEDFRAHQPPPSATRPFHLPKVETFALKNGIKVFLVEQHTLPIVSMDLNFDGGDVGDPKGKEGLASVCMSLLTEGTDKLDKLAYSAALQDVASRVSAYADDDSIGVALASLSKHLDDTFALFIDTIRAPGLRASDFDRLVKRRIENVKQSRGTPAAVSARVTAPVLYGPSHPFGAVVTEASLRAITLDDCKHHAATWLTPKHARLFVVGDLTEAKIRSYFDSPLLASWKGEGGKLPTIAKPATMAGRIFFVNVPGAAQSQVSLLQFGPKRTAADYFANSMLGSVFGGGFASRINMNLREDKGYAYGARGGFEYNRTFGTFRASAQVRTDATYQTILEIDREVKDLWAGKVPVTKDELEREKAGAVLGLPGRFATAQSALGQYRGLTYFGLPLDYFNTYAEKIGKVTEAELKQAAAKEIKPGQAVYLVVGDGSALMKVREGTGKAGKDVPLMKNGTQLTLRDALADLAARGDVGGGGLVELDPDGHPVH